MYGDYDDKDLHGMMRGQDDGESAYYNSSPYTRTREEELRDELAKAREALRRERERSRSRYSSPRGYVPYEDQW